MIFIHIPKTAGTSIHLAISDKNTNFIYSGHNRLPLKNESNFVVLREPINRFWSAIKYSYYNDKEWRGADNLISAGIKTPSDFVKICFDKKHPLFDLCQVELSNNNGHRVSGIKIERSWIYQEQAFWYNKPTHIILFSNLEEELKKINLTISHKNSTSKIKFPWNKQIELGIEKMYPNDFKLWNYWSKLPIEERLNIDWSKHENFSYRL